jgi:hypothetical protein
MHSFNYKNTKTKIRRRVTNKIGKGHKSVKKYHKGKKSNYKKNFSQIKIRNFFPSFFSKNTRRNKKGGDTNIQPTNDTQQQRKLAEIQSLTRENRRNMERYQELDDRLFEIEEMIPEQRQLHAQEENDLTRQIDELREINNQSQQRFEQLRNEYFQQYGVPSRQ